MSKLEWRVEPGIGSSEYLTLGLLDIEVRELWSPLKETWDFRIWGTKDHLSGTYGVISETEKLEFSTPEAAKVAAIAKAREILTRDLMLLMYDVNV